MATRCNIGMVNADGSFTGIYCHYDGYPAGVGKTLLNHYNNFIIVADLMELGNLSVLGEKMHSEDDNHSFKSPAPGVTVAYGRDRGDTDEDGTIYEDRGGYEDSMDNYGTDYQYLFSDGRWLYRDHKCDWSVLTSQVCESV
jgi:hypothetical protein